jgi:hypothetical protein
MAKASKNNNFQGNSGFLSDIVKGEVTVETVNRVIGPDTPWAYHEPEPAVRPIGARSGQGKTLTTK